MQEKNKRLFENLLSMGSMQIVIYLFPLITAPYITRTIGVEKYGLIAFATAFIQYLALLVDFGVEASGTYRISKNRHNHNNISNIFNSIMATKLLLYLVCSVIMVILTFSVPKLREIWLLVFFCYGMVLGNALFPAWFFVGMERMKYMTLLNIVSRTIFMVLLFVFIKKPDDYLWIPFLTSMGSITAGILSLYIAVKKENIQIYIPSWKTIIYQLKFSTQFFITKVLAYGRANTNTFCLGLLGSMVCVGYYTAAYNLYWAMCSLISGITLPLYPYMVKNKDLKFYKKFSVLAIIGFTVLFSLMFIFSKQIITIYYGQKMLEAYPVFQIFCIALLFEIILILQGNSLLGAFGHIKEANNTSIVSSICHYIGLIILFVFNCFNMYSIAALILITTIIGILLRMYYIHKFKIFNNAN